MGSKGIWDRVGERYLDTNGNDRFEANEIVAHGRQELERLELLSKIEPSSIPNETVVRLETATPGSVETAFKQYISRYNSDFACGIEMPTSAQIREMVERDRQAASKIRNNIARPTLGAKFDAALVMLADDFQFHAEYSLALLGTINGNTTTCKFQPYSKSTR